MVTLFRSSRLRYGSEMTLTAWKRAVVTIMDKSWDKIAFFVLFSGRQTPILVHLRNLVPIPQNPTLLPAVSSGFQHCVGWGGGIVTRFYKESSAFFKLLL